MTDQAVSDTGPLRHLTEIGAHPILALFGRIVVPQLVVRELRAQGFWTCLVRDLSQLLAVVGGPTLRAALALARTHHLEAADAAVLAVAAEYPDHILLTDDLALRRAAKRRGHRVVGTIGVVGRAYQTGRLSLAEADAMLERLVDESTLYLTAGVVEQIREAMRNSPRP